MYQKSLELILRFKVRSKSFKMKKHLQYHFFLTTENQSWLVTLREFTEHNLELAFLKALISK
jgi:hypothetical protein